MNTRICQSIIILLLLSSCTKVYDYIKNNPLEAASCCRIDSVTVHLKAYPSPQHFNFLYNAAGQPIKIAAQPPASFQYQDFYFRYDSHNRLKDYLLTDAGGTYIYIWDRYTYPRPGVIVDTTYEYQGHLSDPNPIYPSDFNIVKTITQDAQGRTVKLVIWTPFSQDTTYYRYNAQGNLIVPGVTYDNKVNWYQLSDTWQLIFGDYSVDNAYIPATDLYPASISAYNQYGLPLTFNQRTGSVSDLGANLMVFYYTSMDVSYSCDTAKALKKAGY